MSKLAARLSAWVDALLHELERRGDDLLGFDLIEALVACGPPPAVEEWVARSPVALSRSVLWSEIAEARRARGAAPEAVAAAVERAVEAALEAHHPLPAIDLLRRFGPGAVPAARAQVERFAARPGEWFFGAHAALAEALAAEDPAAALRHLDVALGPRPSFPARIAEHESALEAVVLASSLARRLAALGRTSEAEAQRDTALDRFARGTGTELEDRHAQFDPEEEEGIGDFGALYRAVFDWVFRALPADGDVDRLRAAAGVEALLAAGHAGEARALAESGTGILGTCAWATIAVAARGSREAALALEEARRGQSPAEVRARYEEGLLTAAERHAIHRALGYALGCLGRPAEGLAYLAPLVDEARDEWRSGLRELREPLGAALRGEVVAPWTLFPPVTDAALARARKRPENIRTSRLLPAAASRPGPDGAALLDEALACRADRDLELREGSWPERWLAAYAVHGRLADARRVADRMHADLRFRGRVEMEGVGAFVLALDRGGQQDEAARELARWLGLPPDLQLFAAVLAVAARHGALGEIAARAADALRRIDARVESYRL